MNKALAALIADGRRRRARYLNQIILDIAAEKGGCRVLDLGGEPGYWNDFDLEAFHRLGVRITLLNVKRDPVDQPIFTTVEGDACDLSAYADGEFDLAHSNSTIEHVGGWSRMAAFATEMSRVAPNYYVQTPYFWFPIEPHFLALGFHWLPEAVRVRRLMKRRHGHHPRAATVFEAVDTIRSARLLDRLQMQALFPSSIVRAERFAGLTKSLIAVRLDRSLAV